MEEWKDWKIKEIKLGDKDYPKRLSGISSAPKKLYYRGKWRKDIFENCLAVVGARKMTKYGESIIEKIVPDLVSAGIIIVSGFMYGVDSTAHKSCVENNGKTIAVLGSGLDQIMPSENDELYTDILRNNGLVISEYEKDFKARLWSFPQRNRIVSGLSEAILIIEGGEKSGSLITAKLGFQQKRKVLAIPGPVSSSMSKAPNWLIKNGGIMVTGAKDILKEMGISRFVISDKYSPGGGHVTEVERKVVEILKREEMNIDELSRKLKIDVVQLGQVLSKMNLNGLIDESFGKYVIN